VIDERRLRINSYHQYTGIIEIDSFSGAVAPKMLRVAMSAAIRPSDMR
jgi:hypothetical protein